MFDSRTDRPTFPGTHQHGHAEREDFHREDLREKAARVNAPRTKRAAIAEGLAEWLTPEPFTPPRDCEA